MAVEDYNHPTRDVLKRGDSNLWVKMRKGCGVFEETPEAVQFEWNPMEEVAQYPE